MFTQELSGHSLAILMLITVGWGLLSLLWIQRAKGKIGDLQATYMGDVLPLLIVIDLARTPMTFALGFFGGSIKLGMTAIRVRKLRKQESKGILPGNSEGHAR